MSHKNESFNKELCKKNALAFFKTAVLIDEELRTKEFFEDALGPYTVNLIFSCELLLKYLCYSSCSGEIKGHNLKCLFCQLDEVNPTIADRIREEYYKDVKDSSLFKLERILGMCKNNFEEFRYLHERKQGSYEMHTTSMAAFARALIKVSEEI